MSSLVKNPQLIEISSFLREWKYSVSQGMPAFGAETLQNRARLRGRSSVLAQSRIHWP